MHLVFWHNIISPHQAPYMRELALAGHHVTVVAAEEMSEERRKLGWEVPSLGPARVILSPDGIRVAQIVQSSSADCIHFIAGARGTLLGKQVALACRGARRRMGIITEAPDTRGVGGVLRWVKYASERLTLGSRFDFILAMGEKGMRWFRLCGYPESRLFPFAYVTDRLSEVPCARADDGFQFQFVGRLLSLKGVDLLLRALAEVPSAGLSIIGAGPERERLEQLTQELGLGDRVCWQGQMDAAQVQGWISSADALVLPSRKDGWGAVVNESLMAGTPVICSNSCGAADLIRQPWLGSVFDSGNVADMASALRDWAGRGKCTPVERARIRKWSRCIEGATVARYVEQVMEHVYQHGPRPQAPWREHLQ